MFASLALLSLLKTGARVKTPLVRTAVFHAPEDVPRAGGYSAISKPK